MTDLPLSERQIESLRESSARVNIWSGAIRSGKTIASLLRWLVYVSHAPRGGQLVVVGRTRDSAARNVFAPLQDPSLFGPLADQVHYTSGAPTASILGRTVYVLGASDAKASTSPSACSSPAGPPHPACRARPPEPARSYSSANSPTRSTKADRPSRRPPR
ncbi:hypothetical protein [Saccharopolyspora hattusasensis]|uniref:hypothetical protein n=1 Tax=Saccharopolyspora hattusasensis TaxID=1128679 RepID=UPI003D9809AF